MSDGASGRASPEPAPRTPPEERDLGFGTVVTRESRARLLNRDGTFNVRRRGLGFFRSMSAYHLLLTTTWPRFIALVAGGYVAANAVFALAYVLAGPGAVTGATAGGAGARFADGFFFSVQTLSTIGYGTLAPGNTAANVIVAVEALVGLLGFALVAGLAFARASRPTARILFSDVALVAPYRGRAGFMFRIVNGRRNELLETEARVILVRWNESRTSRTFHELDLERRRVAFLPLTWTVVHPIDENSPLHGADERQLLDWQAEFLVLLSGYDETFSQVVHARSSYLAGEVVFDARFDDIFAHDDPGAIHVDAGRLSDFHRLGRTPTETGPNP